MSESGSSNFFSRGLMSQSLCHLKDNIPNDKNHFSYILAFHTLVCLPFGFWLIFAIVFPRLSNFCFLREDFCSLLRNSSFIFYWMEYSLEVIDVPFKHRPIAMTAIIQEFLFAWTPWLVLLFSSLSHFSI